MVDLQAAIAVVFIPLALAACGIALVTIILLALVNAIVDFID